MEYSWLMSESGSCPCEDETTRDEGTRCEIHEECDEWCKTLRNPISDEEVRKALEHWKDHTWIGACAHGF